MLAMHIRSGLVVFAIAVLCVGAGAQERDRSQGAPTSVHAPPLGARVDINRASTAELLKVPGMTPSWAGRIVRFRPYRSKQDLLDRGVVTSAVYDRIKDYVIAHRAGNPNRPQ
jgi:DNA uptake protein ComE-like DNA-binding protein